MVIVDDIGSFPLPAWISQSEFNKLYPCAREEVIRGNRGGDYEALKKVVIESFENKLSSGIDVATYPQHYDMHKQFLEPIEKYQKTPFLIDGKTAIIPEIEIIRDEAKGLYEKAGKKIALGACVTGPIELYLRSEFMTNIYKDILLNLAKSVNLFLKNSIVNTHQVKTSVLSLDEPSLGFSDLLNVEQDDIIDILEATLKGLRVPVQLHLHTLKAVEIALQTEGVTSFTGEFAASPENLNLIKKKDLESYDKFLRAGVTRTNIDSIIAEQFDTEVEPQPQILIDPRENIESRVKKINSLFGETVSSWGPDCGLGSWPSQEVAGKLLNRTAKAVRESFK